MKNIIILTLTSLLSCSSPPTSEIPEVATIGVQECDDYLRISATCVLDKEGTEQEKLIANIRDKEQVWLRISEKGGEALPMLQNLCEGNLLYLKDVWNCE